MKSANLNLGNRPKSVHGHADGGSDNARLGQGRVEYPVVSKLFLEALGGAEDPAEMPHVLTQDHHGGIAPHLGAQTVVDCLDDVPNRHLDSAKSGSGPLLDGLKLLRRADRLHLLTEMPRHLVVDVLEDGVQRRRS